MRASSSTTTTSQLPGPRASFKDSSRAFSVLAAAALVLAAVSQCGAAAQLADPPLSARPHGSGPVVMSPHDRISFLAVGDWGRQGEYNQSDVAAAMAAVAGYTGAQFVISTGDNFYPSGLVSADDQRFADTFTDVYHQPELQVPWYAVLGNHDYGDGAKAGAPPPECPPPTPHSACYPGPLHQLGARLPQRDGRWFCRRRFARSLAGGAVELFFYDTAPFVQYYYDREWANNRGGLLEQSWRANLAELEADLAASTASWKVVIGHHPVRSNGEEHGDTPELREHVEPLLERYSVQLYLAGHDHDLELQRGPGSGVTHVLSGAGSQTRGFRGTADSLFQHAAAGFVSVVIERDQLRVSFHGLEAEATPLHVAALERISAQRSLWSDGLQGLRVQVRQAVEASEAGLDRVLTLHEAL